MSKSQDLLRAAATRTQNARDEAKILRKQVADAAYVAKQAQRDKLALESEVVEEILQSRDFKKWDSVTADISITESYRWGTVKTTLEEEWLENANILEKAIAACTNTKRRLLSEYKSTPIDARHLRLSLNTKRFLK